MKIRKTIAFLTAFAMIVALIPAMALTASAADQVNAIISDTLAVYKVRGDNLIADGSFETDDWANQITVGKWRGNNGLADTSAMNENPKDMWARSSVARTGQYSISLVKATADGSNALLTDANKPGSIKHYIKNDANTTTTYYVRFYARTDSGTRYLDFAAASVDSESSIPASSVKQAAITEEWTAVDRLVDVKAGEYLLINVYNMRAGDFYIDDFEVYEAYTDNDTKSFSSALKYWKFNYANGSVVSSDITLPGTVRSIETKWESSNPEYISEAGKFFPPADDTPVTLTATLTYKDMVVTRVYTLIARGFREDMEAALIASVTGTPFEDIALPTTVEGFEGSVITGWESSDPGIVSNTGKYNPPSSPKKITLTATVEYGSSVVTIDIPMVAGLTPTLIYNGSFELDLENGTTVPGWTVGVAGKDSISGVAPMTTNTFEYVADETGNHYIVSTGHAALDSPNSIRTYIKLEPNKLYDLSFKTKYLGDGTCDEFYTAAYVVNSNGNELQYNSNYGGFDYPADKSEFAGKLTSAAGWQTVTTTITTDSSRSTLLIASKWLNRHDNNHTDGRWAFDDFILTERVAEFYGDVVINYIDIETGKALKSAKTVSNCFGNTTYTAEASDKANIVVGTGSRAVTYAYDPSSVDSVFVENSKESGLKNVINLYFRKQVPATITVMFLDENSGAELKTRQTANGYVGFEYSGTDEQKAPFTLNGYVYEFVRSESVVPTEKGPNVVRLYFSRIRNKILNGKFETGDTTGWTNRSGGAITGYTIEENVEPGGNALVIKTGGRDAGNSIGTTWNVEVGKEYHLSFWVGGVKPKSGNFQYNCVSDGQKHDPSPTAWDVDGNIIIPFGEQMENGKWTHMETDFVAKTNIVYFQSSWAEGDMKFANFELYSIEADFTADVTINYLDRATGSALQAARTATNVNGALDGSLTYTATAADKADITANGKTYAYDTTSTDTVSVKTSGNVINLYFNEVKAVSVEEPTLDVLATDEIKFPETVAVTYSNGTTSDVAVSWDQVPALVEGQELEVTGTLANGLTTVAHVNVFYALTSSPIDPDQYDTVEVDGLYYLINKGEESIVKFGDFETDDYKTEFKAYNNGAKDLNSAHWYISNTNVHSGEGALTNNANIKDSGGNSDNNLQTYFPIEGGNAYVVTFWEYYPKDLAPGSHRMSAVVATDAPGNKVGFPIETGGYSSWYQDVNKLTPRDRGYSQGWNKQTYIIDTTNKPEAKYILFASSWGEENVEYTIDDFTIYKLASTEAFNPNSQLGSKILVDVNGTVTERLVEKGSALPDFAAEYPGYVINTYGVDTNKPNAGTVYIVDPATTSTLTFNGNKAVLNVVGDAVTGVMFVAQYDADGACIAVVSTDVNGTSAELAFTPASGAKTVKAMVFNSRNDLAPIIKTAGKTL